MLCPMHQARKLAVAQAGARILSHKKYSLLLLLFSELPLLDGVLYNLGAYKKLRMAPIISLDGTFSCTECMSM